MNMMKRYVAFLLVLVLLVGVLPIHTFAEGTENGDAEVPETVTLTVNFVYSHNGSMVTSPWSAQIAKGAEFNQTVSVPAILNFSVDMSKSELPNDVTYTAGATVADPGTLTFAMTTVTSDVNVVLYYEPEDVNFTVNHHFQKVDSDDYDTPEVRTGSGSVEAYAEFAVLEREGFYCLGKPDVVLHGKDAVIDIYYNRHYYTIQFDLDGGVNSPDPIYAKYGTQFDLSAMTKPTKVGYIFDGWMDAAGDSATIVTLTGNATYKAKWSAQAQNADYKFVVWEQNANDNDYSYSKTIPGNTMSGQTVYYSQLDCVQEQHVHSVENCYTKACGYDSEHKHSASCFTDCQIREHTHDDDCYACVEHSGHTVDCLPERYETTTYPGAVTYAADDLYNTNGYRLYYITETISRSTVTEAVTYGNYTIYPNGEVWAASGDPFGSSDSFLKLINGIWYVVTLNSSDSINYAEYRGTFNVTADSNTVTYVDSNGETQSLEMNSVPEYIYDHSVDSRVMKFYEAILDNLKPGEYTYNGDTYTVYANGEIWGDSVLAYNAWFMQKLNGTWYAITLDPDHASANYHWMKKDNVEGPGAVGLTDCTKADHTHGDGSCEFNSEVCDGNSHAHGDDCCIYDLIEHVHTDNCYQLNCAINEHTHGTSCYTDGSYTFDETKWVLKEIASGEVAPDGSTIINVYLDRKTYTLDFYYVNSPESSTYENHDSITARWGEDISEPYKYIASKTYKKNTYWSADYSGDGPWTNYFGIMPVGGGTYYNSGWSFSEGTMSYYGADLNGDYQLIFQVDNVGGTSVSTEDYFEFEGYVLNTTKTTPVNSDSAGAEVYYDRASYNLVYMNGNGNEVHKESLLFQQPMNGYGDKYTPTNPPAASGLESDAEFVGWYKDPNGQVRFDFDGSTMPSNSVTIYAKWVNKRYTVTTWMTSEMNEKYTYEDYTGSQSVEKYQTAPITPTDPPATKEGIFMGWYYLDEDNAEQRFSFTMPITQDYNLYPRYTEKYSVTYTVEYKYEDSNGNLVDAAPSEQRSNMFGKEVTELAKTGSALTGIDEAERSKYFPDATSKTVFLDSENVVIQFVYEKMGPVQYKVKYVDTAGQLITEDANGNPIENPVVKTTEFAIVTEFYLDIPGYVPKQYQITQELVASPDFEKGENTITFVYGGANGNLKINKAGVTDTNAPFVFRITGEGVSMEVVIYGNGSETIAELPAGDYTVEEITGYWRYSLDSTKTVEVSGGQDAEVTFTNSRNENKWLDDYASATNVFGSGN